MQYNITTVTSMEFNEHQTEYTVAADAMAPSRRHAISCHSVANKALYLSLAPQGLTY